MRSIRLVTLVSLVAVAGVAVSGADAAQADASANWAGYVASAVDPYTDFQGSFSAVSGSWVQPASRCGAQSGTGSTASAFWVGLGGNSDSSNALEQVGTESDCTAAGTTRYYAWYELVPASSVTLKLKVHAGDTMAASVRVNGTKVAVAIRDVTTGAAFARTLSMASPDTSSAEWIAEAPSMCSTSNRCRQASLTNFGKVAFSHASAASAGHTGTISDPAWTSDAVELDSSAGQPSYGDYGTESGAVQALPGALRNRGAAFTVSWSRQQAVAPAYGGGGYGGYGWPGY
jgi:hypothetical protein